MLKEEFLCRDVVFDKSRFLFVEGSSPLEDVSHVVLKVSSFTPLIASAIVQSTKSVVPHSNVLVIDVSLLVVVDVFIASSSTSSSPPDVVIL